MSDKGRIGRLVVSQVWAGLAQPFRFVPQFFTFAGSTPADRLLIAPQDLRTADGINAPDIYGGRFLFSGHLVETHGASPFEMEGMHPDWLRELHEFGWVRDLRAADSHISRQNARALVDDWLRLNRRGDRIAWNVAVVNRRVMSWLAHSPFILVDGDHEFYARFVRSLIRQVRFLRRNINAVSSDTLRLQIALTLTAASIALSSERRTMRASLRKLDHELQRQILTDGGHVSRNPMAVIETLADLLPVRQALVSQGIELPASMLQSVDRMMPIMRFFRHADGSFAQFNGMGPTPRDLVATILAYDDARGVPPENVPHTGYQRLSGGPSMVLVDTGRPPPPAQSREAHAGCLSFEFSSGLHRLVVNCGVAVIAADRWRRVARSTAAHSTVTVEETSSAKFLGNLVLEKLIGTPVLDGPRKIEIARSEDENGQKLFASHDGYEELFALRHLRNLVLSQDGTLLRGLDAFEFQEGKKAAKKLDDYNYAVRFHIHPNVTLSYTGEGESVLLALRDGEMWEFHAPGADLAVEESVFLSDASGPRRAEQIVLYGNVGDTTSVAWQFVKVAEGSPDYAPVPVITDFDYDAFDVESDAELDDDVDPEDEYLAAPADDLEDDEPSNEIPSEGYVEEITPADRGDQVYQDPENVGVEVDHGFDWDDEEARAEEADAPQGAAGFEFELDMDAEDDEPEEPAVEVDPSELIGNALKVGLPPEASEEPDASDVGSEEAEDAQEGEGPSETADQGGEDTPEDESKR